MLKAIKHFLKVVRMSLCRHRFVLMDNEYNRVSKMLGCSQLWYKCPKCGRIFYADVEWTVGNITYPRGRCHGISNRWSTWER